ncbi:MAG: SRPBCC domain-containing protein [Sediminibacterium sp.]|nr:SRPBCC domain-containing protein [Sediminibacterium sp.]
MRTLIFKIDIKADAQRVWNILWNEKSYQEWTKIFTIGSYYKTDQFCQGSKIQFLSPKGDGLYSIIEKIIENKLVVFNHLGDILNFVEQPLERNPPEWVNAKEMYELMPTDSGIELMVSCDTIDSCIEQMNKIFPLALKEVKRLAEITT